MNTGRMTTSRSRRLWVNMNEVHASKLPRISFQRGSTLKNLLNTKIKIIESMVVVIYAIASCVSIIDPGNTVMKKSIACKHELSVN